MTDYISREAAISMFAELQELANKRVCDTPADSPCYMRYVTQARERDDTVRRLRKLPAADVRPVVRGKWIAVHGNYFTPGGTPVVKCSICGCAEHLAGVEFPEKFKFCPNCGADMRGEINND